MTSRFDPAQSALDALASFTRRINRLFLFLGGIFAVLILGALTWDLVARNVFDAPTMWALDISRFLLMFLFFLSVAPALESGSHVSVDILDHYLGRGPRRVLRIVAHSLTLVFGAFLLWQIWRTTWEAFVDNSQFPIVVPLKLKHVYWVGLLGVVQFMLTGVVQLWTAWRDEPEASTIDVKAA